MRKENSLLVNENRDLKNENENLKDNLGDFHRHSDDSNKIVEYERENRRLKSECDYFK
jgi:hypothetical protein